MLGRLLGMLGRLVLCTAAVGSGAVLAHAMRPGPGEPVVAAEEDVAPPPPLDEPDDGPPTPALVATARILPTEPDAFGTSLHDGMVITGSTPHRFILFTFDDGPDHRYTPRLLDRLDAFGIKALFFLTGRRFAGHRPRDERLAEIARDIVRRGHLVGSHTMDHIQLPTLQGEPLATQVVGTEDVFERVLGQRPYLIRPPGGSRSPRIDAWLASRGYTQVLWNLGAGDGDPQVRTSDEVFEIFRRVLDRRERENGERGGIVLLHDIHEWSMDAFPRIVRMLEQRNCELLADGDELYDFVSDPSVFYTPRRDASASTEAPPALPDPAWVEERQAVLRERTAARCERLAMR
jgi:peptidoglycan/xylan/chitin deacetylase (PgdA/CDA1 family)